MTQNASKETTARNAAWLTANLSAGWFCLLMTLPGVMLLTYSLLKPGGHSLGIWSVVALIFEVVLPWIGFLATESAERTWLGRINGMFSLTVSGVGQLAFGWSLLGVSLW